MPVAKLTTLKNIIKARKPVRFSERCGVRRAEKICTSLSLADRSRSISLPVLIVPQYIPIMAKITRKAVPRKTAVPKKKAKPAVAKPRAAAKKSLKATKLWTPSEIHEAFSRFRKANPEPKGELEHLNPFTLLVAVVLSAQATDAGVNKATRELFEVADTPQKMLDLGEGRLRDYIRTIGLYRTKAKNVIALSAKLLSEFGGEVPRTRAEIESLPGAGRKTANVVLNMAFGEHTMAVDTHVFRVGNRTGLAPGKTPLEVELGLEKVIPAEFMLHAHHWLILHGRYTCLARRPRCEICLINDLCRWPEKTV
ncbi:endonuclease-3 [Bradyrhizobium sp. LM2.7]